MDERTLIKALGKKITEANKKRQKPSADSEPDPQVCSPDGKPESLRGLSWKQIMVKQTDGELDEAELVWVRNKLGPRHRLSAGSLYGPQAWMY